VYDSENEENLNIIQQQQRKDAKFTAFLQQVQNGLPQQKHYSPDSGKNSF